jgi:hypothetical protein
LPTLPSRQAYEKVVEQDDTASCDRQPQEQGKIAVPIGLSIALTDEVLTAIARDQTTQAQKHDLGH